RIDIPSRTINVMVEAGELQQRRSQWQPPPAKIQVGWLGRYCRMVTSASRGAVLVVPEALPCR
ncbi:MAG TPA: dihydroxy-acid dehydratase, partial [Polyangiaceae bacterium]